MPEQLLLFSLIASTISFGTLVLMGKASEPQRPFAWLLQGVVLSSLSSGVYFLAWRDPEEAAGFGLAMFGVSFLFSRLFKDWHVVGQVFYATFTSGLLVFLVYVQWRILETQDTVLGLTLSNILFTLEAGSAVLTVYYAYEVLNVMSRVRWRRAFFPVTFATGNAPKVSIHVPAHSEPVEMVQETLQALAELEYPNYEVIMIDDNTDDSALWQPILDFCRDKGFKVFHLQDYPGFKSGALNFALTQTASDAEIIAVVDSDYIVSPEYLKETSPYFQNPSVAFVQTPQSFRNLDNVPFRENAALAQRYFFDIGMVSRNERNSIIFCGTMGLIRKDVLRQIGGWSEWCITEDAEASLRILRLGYESVYLNKVFGRGLVPETFDDTKKQRFRWAFGGVQILKRYWRWLIPLGQGGRGSKRLTLAQRTDYLLGFLGWFNDLLILVFTGFILLTAASYVAGVQLPIRQLLGLALVVPALAIFTGTLRVAWALRQRTGCSWREGLGAFFSMLSLSWTIAQACASAITHSRGVFLRTAKTADHGDVIRALRVTRWEALIGLTLLLAVVALLSVDVSVQTLLLSLLLVWHSGVYLSSVFSALTESSVRKSPRGLGKKPGRVLAQGSAQARD